MVTFEELKQRQYIKNLEKTEKDQYVSFHLDNYKLDIISAANFLNNKNAKYAAIAGYYAVLNITLWYFAKYFNLKISEKDVGVHKNCQVVLDKFVKDQKLKEKILSLLTEAEKEFTSFTVLKKKKEETLPLILKQSADKRKKYTYYSSQKALPQDSDKIMEARNFVEHVVKPYISIMEKLQC